MAVQSRILSQYRKAGSEDFHDLDEDVVYTGDPTAQLPIPPPSDCDASGRDAWFQRMCEVTDEIIYRSNLHDEKHRKGCKPNTSSQCKGRFPRDIEPVSWRSEPCSKGIGLG